MEIHIGNEISRRDSPTGTILKIFSFALTQRPDKKWRDLFNEKYDICIGVVTARPHQQEIVGDQIDIWTTPNDVEKHKEYVESIFCEANKEYR